MQRTRWIGLMSLLLMLIAACGARAITPTTPPEIVYGEDVCDHCGMIINEARFAAGVVIQTEPDRYEHRVFDDIGDMFAFDRELAANSSTNSHSETIVTYFVHDYASQEWLDATVAYFVNADPSLTPMGSGIVAFASEESATDQAELWHGTVLSFDTVRNQGMADHSHVTHR